MPESVFRNRHMPRSRVNLTGAYQYGGEWFPCTFYDLSGHGAGLKISQFFVPGDVIALKFGLHSEQRVLHATIANVNGTRVGTRFHFEPSTESNKEFLEHILGAYRPPARRPS